uniref:ATPase8 n=1 Tax=Chaceon granulatus TaxID=557237 RepID=W6JGX4_9EUCA|nr:ATP synthase F0 subunit 8 [Chaceon granulatus]BAO48248.1 ATPase8 [Chaceon granulatus]
MPQMAPLMWLCLYIFFLLCLMLFMTTNHFIKPFEKINSEVMLSHSVQSPWKL